MPGTSGETTQGPSYKTFNVDGDAKVGITEASEGIMPDGAPCNWIVYWGVADADATFAVLGLQ